VLIPSVDGDEVEVLEEVGETFFAFIEPLLRVIGHLIAHHFHSGDYLSARLLCNELRRLFSTVVCHWIFNRLMRLREGNMNDMSARYVHMIMF
jgi:hypothetical protein